MKALPDELWAIAAPLLPPPPPRPYGGRPRASDRKALAGILFVLKTGIQWKDLPTDVFGVSGITCWRRLRDWQALGVWKHLHDVMLQYRSLVGALDWSRASMDSQSVPAKR